jgi:hypothetical protein
MVKGSDCSNSRISLRCQFVSRVIFVASREIAAVGLGRELRRDLISCIRTGDGPTIHAVVSLKPQAKLKLLDNITKSCAYGSSFMQHPAIVLIT